MVTMSTASAVGVKPTTVDTDGNPLPAEASVTSTRNEVAATANRTGSELVNVSHLPWSVPAKLVATASAGITSPSAITAATVWVQPGNRGMGEG